MAVCLPRILVVDDEQDNLDAIQRTLHGKFDCLSVTRGAEALKLAKEHRFAVVLSDQRMPDLTGTELLSQIAQIQPLATRVILTAHTDIQDILEAINRAEIYRYLTKPWENHELITTLQQAVQYHELLTQNQNLIQELRLLNKNLESRVEKRTLELKLANDRLAELAMTDPLTKILNRRAFSKKIIEEIDRSSRYKHPLVVAMIDVDHFKHFNDTEGHVLGDEALKKIAQLFLGNLRKSDTLARYGGEEFVIMMPETKLASGVEICERLRSAVESNAFQGQERAGYLTVSIGLCEYPQAGDTAEGLIQAADKALYEAKQSGRNRVMTDRHVKQSSFFIT